MTLISMCEFKDCPKAETCFRYNAEPEKEWQSYSDFVKICPKSDYQYYWPMKIKNKE